MRKFRVRKGEYFWWVEAPFDYEPTAFFKFENIWPFIDSEIQQIRMNIANNTYREDQ